LKSALVWQAAFRRKGIKPLDEADLLETLEKMLEGIEKNHTPELAQK